MAGRIRSIKPEILDDELAASLGDTAWRLWVSSWVLADDYGNFRAAAKYLAAQTWQDTTRFFDAILALEELKDAVSASGEPMVTPYIVNGQRYGHIKGFQKHQRQDNISTKKRLPGPDESDGQWFPEVSLELATKRAKSRRVAAVRGDQGEFAALTSYLRPPTTEHRPPTAATDAPASASAGRRETHGKKDLESSGLTEPERAVHAAILADPSLQPIVQKPCELARDLVRVGPGLDVPSEVRQAGAWLRANPAQRKSNGNRFLNNWVIREQDKGGRTNGRSGPARSVQPPAAIEFKPAQVLR